MKDECNHNWEVAQAKDRFRGEGTGHFHGYTEVIVVCKKCGEVKKSEV